MSKKTSVVGEMSAAVKPAASSIGAGAEDGSDGTKTLHEKVVPVPHADVYSELPFAKVEEGGRRLRADPRDEAPKRPTPSKKAVKKAGKAPRKAAKVKATPKKKAKR